MILLIDNYDSFAHNLARYFRRLGNEVICARNDAIDVGQIARLEPELIVMSPGPCTPNETGCCLAVMRDLGEQFAILGVCLGHQVIVQGLGGEVVRADEPVHGRASAIYHDGQHDFMNVPNPFVAGRYHSLVACRATLPDSLSVTAWTEDGLVMAVRHSELRIIGWQFHPESILTENGYPLLANLLAYTGIKLPQDVPTIESERTLVERRPVPLPQRPITF
jgi:anthranilate synthase/aminodeoxychorismate synthase-like glutamine amidotransferase